MSSRTPIVFSAVNASPATYGFDRSTNDAGVLEQEHFVETVHLLTQIARDIKTIAAVFDEDSTWPPVRERMKDQQGKIPDVEFTSWDTIHTFEEFKQKMAEYEATVDAVGLIGIFHFKDENGENVPYQEVLQWVAENSNLPDFSFWQSRVVDGTLCAVTVSGYEQGLAAGKIARGILVEGRKPSSYPMNPTLKGEPVISLARANRLGLKVDSDILLAAAVSEDFGWDK